MEPKTKSVTVNVPQDSLAVSVGDALAISISVAGDKLFVWCKQGRAGGKGIQIPIGRVADALSDLIDAEFERKG